MYEIDKLPKGAVVTAVDHDGMGYEVLLPDGERWFVSIVPDDSQAGFRVVKTIFPAGMKVEISVADPKERP